MQEEAVREQLSITEELNNLSLEDPTPEATTEESTPVTGTPDVSTTETPTEPQEDSVESINETEVQIEEDDLDKIDPEEFDFDADEQEDPIKPVEKETEDGEESKSDEEILAEYKDITAEELTKDPQLADRIRGAFMATSRGRKIFESYRTLRDLEKAPEEGGIGFRPDKETIVRDHQLAAGHENLLRDLEGLSDDDEIADNVLQFITGGTDRIKNESSAVLVSKLPYFLARNRPELLVGLETQILEANARRFEEMAKGQSNQKVTKYYSNLARAIRRELGSDPGPTNMAPTSGATETANNIPPNVAQELEQLRQEKQKWAQQQSKANDERLNSYYNEFMDEANGVVSGLFEKMFVDLKEPNGVLKPYKDRIVTDTVGKVLSNETFRARLERSIDDAFKSGSVQQRKQALQDLRRNVIPYVRQVATNVREDLKSMRPKRQSAVEKADADRTKLTQQADNKAPDGGGVAAPSGTNSGIEQFDPTKETYQQFLNRQLAI